MIAAPLVACIQVSYPRPHWHFGRRSVQPLGCSAGFTASVSAPGVCQIALLSAKVPSQSGECIFLHMLHTTFMLTYLAYFCIFCAYKCIWMHMRNTYRVTAYFCVFVQIICYWCIFKFKFAQWHIYPYAYSGIQCIFVHIKNLFMHILEMHIFAYLVFHIYAYFLHIYVYGNFASMCIFCVCIFWYVFLVMHMYCIFLICLFVHVPAYLVLHIAAYFLTISAHLNLHIMAYLPFCILKHRTRVYAYKMHIYVYCLFCT